MIRTATDLYQLPTFEARYRYLSLSGQVGASTFGYDRWINQAFYRSAEWKHTRNAVIARDLGCDLGVEGYEIHERVIIHHMNPMVALDIINGDEAIINPEYLITVTHQTHNAIHYGDERLLRRVLTPRRAGDTVLWHK